MMKRIENIEELIDNLDDNDCYELLKDLKMHSLRKCFGREIFNRSDGNAELALVKLSQLFNHSNPAITRRYLGISKQELLDTYDVLSF